MYCMSLDSTKLKDLLAKKPSGIFSLWTLSDLVSHTYAYNEMYCTVL